ncbi:MAG: hypothetical protein Q9166_001930 [cf. Caloplaca sp. 2 TL-2023]
MSPPRPFSLNSQLFNPTLYSRLLNLWFSNLPRSASAPAPTQLSRWFGAGITPESKRAFDDQCTSTALPALQSIAADKFPLPPFTDIEQDRKNYPGIAEPFIGQFTSTGTEAKGNEEAALGLILLLDQMPRNTFRSQQSLIYTHYDRISRAVAHEIYSLSLDTSSTFGQSPAYQMWFYLPLEHSEALSDHDLMRKKLGDMKTKWETKKDEKAVEFMGTLMGFEKQHRDILERFGRYPHRNGVMGREETGEEREYLDGGGDTFGTG